MSSNNKDIKVIDYLEANPYERFVDNRALINVLVAEQRKQVYNTGFVYLMYVRHAKYYNVRDLQYICKIMNYKKFWITIKSKVLSRSSKWKD